MDFIPENSRHMVGIKAFTSVDVSPFHYFLIMDGNKLLDLNIFILNNIEK